MDTIYLLKDQVGNYKIGYTKLDVKTRKAPLLTGNSGDLEVIYEHKTNHKRKIESALHRRFKSKHVIREFYQLDDEDVIKFPEICNTLEEGLDALKAAENPFY